jgi:peptidoglycan/LPS O-acetylase OafA/YrhL
VTSHAPPLSQTTSFFLDVLRLFAAFTVFTVHVVILWYPSHYTPFEARFVHRAVIIFFVLSGYVIAYSTLRKERDPRAYVLARLSRLYSVLLPALVLTALLQIAGTALDPAAYDAIGRGHDPLRYGLVALFLQSIWILNSAPPTNSPFWSLCHEFWYYALFGAAVLIRPVKARLVTITGLALVCGMNVLLLMPSWLMGVGCYAWGRAGRLPRGVALMALACVLFAIALCYLYLPDWPYPVAHPPFYYSAAAGSDAAVGLLFALLVWLFDQALRDLRVPDRLDAAVRWFADHTYSLYLYHFPLLFFTAAVVPFDHGSLAAVAVMILLVLAVVFGLILLTESKRPAWRRLFGRIWDRAAGISR